VCMCFFLVHSWYANGTVQYLGCYVFMVKRRLCFLGLPFAPAHVLHRNRFHGSKDVNVIPPSMKTCPAEDPPFWGHFLLMMLPKVIDAVSPVKSGQG
jgi:hypothetical protein